MKRIIFILIAILLLPNLSACIENVIGVKTSNNTTIKDNTIITENNDNEFYQIYMLALTSGYNGTYEEWLAFIKGEKSTSNIEIKSTLKTSSDGFVDTYTITFTDEPTLTFTIANGKDEENDKQEEKIILNYKLKSETDEYEIIYSDYYKAYTNIVIPNVYMDKNVTSIGNEALSYCSSLESITIPNSVKFIGHSIVPGCCSLSHINYTESENEWNAIKKEIYIFLQIALLSIIIQEKIIKILQTLFNYFVNLKAMNTKL